MEGLVSRGTTRMNADVVVGLGWEPNPVRLSASFRVTQRPDHEIIISTVRCRKRVEVTCLVRRGTTRRNADVVVGLGWEPNPVRLSASFRVTQRPDHEIIISTVRCRKRVEVTCLVRRGTTRRNADVIVGLGWEPNPVRLSASFRVTQRPDHEILSRLFAVASVLK